MEEAIKRLMWERAAFEDEKYRQILLTVLRRSLGRQCDLSARNYSGQFDLCDLRVSFGSMCSTIRFSVLDIMGVGGEADRMSALVDGPMAFAVDALRGFNSDGTWNHALAFA